MANKNGNTFFSDLNFQKKVTIKSIKQYQKIVAIGNWSMIKQIVEVAPQNVLQYKKRTLSQTIL